VAEVVKFYDLRPDELETLEDVCQMTDMIAALSADWVANGSPMIASGSMGQLVIHPIIGELRSAARAQRPWRQLRLPDADGKRG